MLAGWMMTFLLLMLPVSFTSRMRTPANLTMVYWALLPGPVAVVAFLVLAWRHWQREQNWRALAPWLRTIVGVASVAAFLLVWQVVGMREIIRSDLISYPTEIASALSKMITSGELWSNLVVTLQEFRETRAKPQPRILRIENDGLREGL